MEYGNFKMIFEDEPVLLEQKRQEMESVATYLRRSIAKMNLQ